ncbi:stage III sporulation protein AF [Virgibacillus xinjiangensis]|uniref:Stage III sporulation protein AF n=1 Tax=Virgibacillus xinjiangensis TaxID=393090 RepID=A0ABV7CRK3_9BACI
MDILFQWVTQIILFLLLAAVIDLLIPATTMKKYIKLTIGLILILLILQPIFYIFDVDIEQQIDAAFSQMEAGAGKEDSMKNLIEMQKNEIQASQDAYILEQMAVQLKDLARDPLMEKHQAEINDITFTFSQGEDYSFESLEEVIVYLQDHGEGEGAVNVVEEIVIDTEEQESADEEQNEHEEVKLLLREVWEIYDKEITVIWEGGTT